MTAGQRIDDRTQRSKGLWKGMTSQGSRFPSLLPVLAGIWIGSLFAANRSTGASPGYLLAVGPSPLRFETVRPRPESVEVLLKTEMPEQTAPELENGALADAQAIRSLGPTPDTAEPLDFSDLGTTLPELPPEEAESSVRAVTRESNTISPQLFLKYFARPNSTSTNSPGVRVIAPIEFRPPPPVVAPFSSATYTTPPP
jgi:hypothetical protein